MVIENEVGAWWWNIGASLNCDDFAIDVRHSYFGVGVGGGMGDNDPRVGSFYFSWIAALVTWWTFGVGAY